MPDSLYTERLRLDPWGPEHDELLLTLSGRPEVMRFIGDGSPWPRERARDVSARTREHWHRHGFGWRPEVEVETGATIGFAGLNLAGEDAGIDPDEFEIGWWLAPEFQGRGLAREGAVAIRDEAFTRLSADSVVARIQPANAASLSLARAIGLVPEGTARGRAGETITILRLTARDWRRAPEARQE